MNKNQKNVNKILQKEQIRTSLTELLQHVANISGAILRKHGICFNQLGVDCWYRGTQRFMLMFEKKKTNNNTIKKSTASWSLPRSPMMLLFS